MPWLLKTEPETYSIDDLALDKRTWWEGVRNYQARNFMRDSMRIGELVLIHHSSADPPGVAGIARVSALAQPDLTAQDPSSPYFDPTATSSNPTWVAVEIEFVERFERVVDLSVLRGTKGLESMPLLKPGQRLSVQPVSASEFTIVRELAKSSGGSPKVVRPARKAAAKAAPKARAKNPTKAATKKPAGLAAGRKGR